MTSRIEDIFIWLLEKSTGIALITICILLVRYFLKKYQEVFLFFMAGAWNPPFMGDADSGGITSVYGTSGKLFYQSNFFDKK